ncbi:hypothetical protein PMAYCL1PPCAC_15043, partial [Pristionchus mayeri]
MNESSEWTPPTPATPRIESVPLSNYMIVSKESLTSLLLECPKCEQGQCHLSFHMVGLAASCTRECNRCDFTATWHSSPVLKTSKASNKEKLPTINVDFVSGAILSAVGGTKLRLLLMMSGVTPLSTTSFHRLKKFYVSPAVDELFFKKQGELVDELRKRVAKGEKIHICGDGSFDSRGYSAAYCRYFLLNAETGEAIHYVLIHKSETGSSAKMEVAALEQGLRELSLMIGGSKGIASVVTDRHSAVAKMMKEKYPGIKHFYDPWHFFRNITMTLLTVCKAKYMESVRFWVKPIINRCYDAVISAQGNGELAQEKFRAILLCIQGKHRFDQV